LSGAARPEHLQSNLNALKTTFDEEAEQNLSGLVEEPGTYWALRSELSWN
jgi:aryl-alcohol dehydrogenase-like predicted oxidoreductase